MRKYKKYAIVLFPLVLTAFIILGCGDSLSSAENNESTSTNSSGSKAEEVENQEVEVSSSSDTVGDSNNLDLLNANESGIDDDATGALLNIGDTAVVDDLKIQVLDYKFSDYADGKQQNKVQDGLKYCVVYLKVKNLGTQQKDLGGPYNNLYTTTLTYNKDYKYHSTWTRDPYFFFANDSLPSLGEIDCIVTFEVAKEVEEQVDNGLTFTFEINNIWKDQQTTVWTLR